MTYIKLPSQAQVDAFKAAWQTADNNGLKGSRVVIGLTAALNVGVSLPGFSGAPTSTHPRLRDVDGDYWHWFESDQKYHHAAEVVGPRSRENIEENWGPVEEVPE